MIAALDSPSIYEVPLSYHREGFDDEVCWPISGWTASLPIDLRPAGKISSSRIREPEGEVTIGVVGKYTSLIDSYKSLGEALAHGGIANNVRVKLDWIDSEIFDAEDAPMQLEHVNGILVPGGFGERGAEGKIKRRPICSSTHGVPYFGICFGMQMAVIEAARHSGQPPPRQLDRVWQNGRSRGWLDDRMGPRQPDRKAVPV